MLCLKCWDYIDKKQDWSDDNDTIKRNLLEQKQLWVNRSILNNIFTTKLSAAQLKVQGRLREMQNKWWKNKSAEIQHAADSWDFKTFYSLQSEIYGPMSS